MQLEGIHHITAITADGRRNLEFYTGVLGLRLVAKSVNQDDASPTYHLFYADEDASPGADLTFFVYPGVPLGRAGAGMVHRITWRVASEQALDFWQERLNSFGFASNRSEGALRLRDPEGLELELAFVESEDEPLSARHPDIPEQFSLKGFHGVRAYSMEPAVSRPLLEETLGFSRITDRSWEARGSIRGALYSYDAGSGRPGLQGAGTVHHVAWRSVTDEEHPEWRQRLLEAGASPTPVIDRYYFRSIYFREPSGVLFEIASPGPGFTRDTPVEELGNLLALPPWLEPRRGEIEASLVPLPNPRESWAS